jgi:hypothetical protein
MKTAGVPLSMSFDLKRRRFTYVFLPDSKISAPTELFIPRFHFPAGYRVDLSQGSYRKDEPNQLLLITSAGKAETTVTVVPER